MCSLFVMAIMDGRIVEQLGITHLQMPLLLLLILLALPQSLRAETITTGSDLQEACNSAEHFSDCVIFLKTVYQTAKAINRSLDHTETDVIGSCGPEQGIDTVPLVIALKLAWQEYATKFPGRMQNLAVEEALLAFEARWPCTR